MVWEHRQIDERRDVYWRKKGPATGKEGKRRVSVIVPLHKDGRPVLRRPAQQPLKSLTLQITTRKMFEYKEETGKYLI
jgi:hypothetical protein